MGYLLGIDLGTSSVKAMIVDTDGYVKAIGQMGFEVLTPMPGYAEQDPGVWWENTKSAIHQALRDSGLMPNEISAIGLSGQMHGMVALDGHDDPVGNALIHLDQRSAGEKSRMMEKAGTLLQTELMNQVSTGMLICSLSWMKHYQPEAYRRIRCVMSPKDYIRYKLTGETGTEYSDASATLAFSVKKGRWCDELLDRLDIDRALFKEIHASTDIAGTVTKQAARETGLFEGTPVAYGSGDCMAASIGNGVIKEGNLACNIGTASQLAVIVKTPRTDANMTCQLWCHAIPNTWLFQGGALNGGNTLGWLKNKIFCSEGGFSKLDEEALKIEAGSEGILFLPYLAGERTPFNNPSAKGVYFGLTMKHSQAHIVKATMEGVMFNLCECRNVFTDMQISVNKLISSGGAAQGKTWRQIQADMLDMPVYTSATKEEACMGAAVIAAVAIGQYKSIEEACENMVRLSDDVTNPIPVNAARYRERQYAFHHLYKSLEQEFNLPAPPA